MNYKIFIFLTAFILLFSSVYKTEPVFAVDSEEEQTGNGAVVSFVCDDLSPNDWNFRDIFRDNGVAYTIPTVVENVGSELSQANLLTLQNDYGYEIASHGVNHVRMTQQTPDDLIYQLEGSKTQLRNMGFECNNFFVPYGDFDQRVLDEAIKHYRAVRTSRSALNTQPFNLQHIKGYWIDVIELDQAKERVDAAIASNAWLVLSFHTNGTDLDFINNYVVPLINYIKSKDIPILTFDKALDYYGIPPLDEFDPIPPDTEKPVLTGIADLVIDMNSAFDPLNGITATDNRDGNITSRVTVTGIIDVTKGGIYTLTYSVSDMAGNTVSAERKITVIDHSVPELQPLHELPNGIKDEISGDTIIRRVGVVTFNGTEDWQRYAVGAYSAQTASLAFKFLFPDAFELADNNTFYLSSSNISVYSFNALGTDGLEGVALTSFYDYTKMKSEGYFIFRIIKTKCKPRQNADGFKNWLTQNQITVLYPLKTPYTEALPPDSNYTNPYEVEDSCLLRLDTQSNSLQGFKVSFHTTGNAAVKVFNKQSNELFSGNVGTGMKVRLYKNNIINEEYTVVLYGDIDGDGLIHVADLILFKKHSLGQFTADIAQRKALNFDRDEENKISIIDLLSVKQMILNK